MSLFPSTAFARRYGILSSGCDGCHRDGAAPNVALAIEPASFEPGQTVTVSVSITSPGAEVGGFYLLSDTGHFTLQAGESTLLITDTEVTHGAPKGMTSGAATFRTSWTAPASPGGVRFQTWALSGNGDGRTSGDGGGEASLSLAFGCAGQKYTLDFDGDGWGQAGARTLMNCAAPAGFASAVGDCNDRDAGVYPGAPEICNNRDDSCDGEADEGLTTGLVTLYEDVDGDGHGALFGATQTVMGCVVPAGFSPVPDDCDDGDAAISPDVAETCNLLDDDCDQMADEELRPECGIGMCLRRSTTCEAADCVPGQPKPEICNYADDDCDGEVDEDAALCGSGQLCYFGRCLNVSEVPAPSGVSSEPDNFGGMNATNRRPTSAGGCALAREPRSRSLARAGFGLAIVAAILCRRRRRIPSLFYLLSLVFGCAPRAGDSRDSAADGGAERPYGGLRVALGAGHSCALGPGGTPYCWGSNPDGQLGDGTETIGRTQPAPVRDLSGVTSLAAGSYHTCALLDDGGVACWGWNVGGQIGDETTHNRLAPFRLDDLGGTVAIALGSYHSCALLGDGSARCWGQNDAGQLGNGSLLNFGTPTAVFSLPPSRALAAGGRHTCALLNDGTVQCWGGNDYGELGDGTVEAHVFPEPVIGVAGAIGIAAGFNHTCALLSGGAVRCWGSNQYGQLGDGTIEDRVVPVSVAPLEGAIALACGYNHTCAVLADGRVQCWGWNAAGQLGDGSTDSAPAPALVQGLAPTSAVAGGGFHTCAVAQGTKLFCWGSNDSGQLGKPEMDFEASPSEVSISAL